jgi:hypothetical protein
MNKMNEYIIEYLGALIISYALVFTHENPLIVAAAHGSVLYISRNTNFKGYFVPLSLILEYLLHRIDLVEASIRLGIQILAALSIVLIYKGGTL